jgi:hypothetical protein
MPLDALHIISHASPSAIILGRSMLDAASVDRYAKELSNIGQRVSADGEILLHACELAARTTGARLIERLAALTGATVAIATERPGNSCSLLERASRKGNRE